MRTWNVAVVIGVMSMGAGVAQAQTPPRSGDLVELSLQDGLVIKDPSTNARLRLGVLARASVQGRFDGGQDPQLGFSLDHARPFLDASLLNGRVGLFVQQELASGDARLLDVEASVRLGECACAPRLVMGYYRPWTTRSFRVGLPVLALPTRGAVAQSFHGARDLGVTLAQDVSNGLFEYYVGVFEGANIPQAQRYPRRATLRVAYNPLGPVPYTQVPWFSEVSQTRVSLALNSAWENPARFDVPNGAVAPEVMERHDATVGGDVTVLGGRWSMTGEGFFRAHSGEDESSWGAYMQGSGLILEDLLDASVRAGVLYDALGQRETILHLDASSTLYMQGPSARLMLYYSGRRDLSGDATRQDAVGVQAQLFF